MATVFTEFDSTPQALLQDLRTRILSSSDWSYLSSDTPLGSLSSATAVGATTLPVFSSTPYAIGMSVMVDSGTLREYRTITNTAASSITVNTGMTFAHGQGAEIRPGQQVYKAVTTRGAQMVVDLNASPLLSTGAGMTVAMYSAHDGTVGQGEVQRFLNWRYNAASAATHPLHVTLSLGKEHFFLMIEGPRSGETGAVSTQYGSFRNYIFLSDVIPYDVSDTTPVVFSGGALLNSSTASVTNSSHVGHTSRNLQNTASWTPARLASLQFPMGGEANVLNVQRQRQVDGKYILAPYVVFSDETGMRGRLSSFFFAGFNHSSEFEVPPPPSGTKVEYQGRWYKLIAVNKGDGTRAAWGQFGGANNDTSSSYARSPVVAVPCLP